MPLKNVIFQAKRTPLALENTIELKTDKPGKVLEYLYAANYPWLEKYIQQNSGDKSDAQDIFQESIYAAWTNLKQGRFTGSTEQFNAYLRQICKYKWLNHLKAAPHQKIRFNDDLSVYDSADTSAEIIEIQLEEGRMLKRCFEQLGSRCRQVLSLFYYKRKPLAEIAGEMNNTEESMKTIKYRCMIRLRKLFIEQTNNNGQV